MTEEEIYPTPDALAQQQEEEWHQATAPNASELVRYPPGRADYRPRGAVLVADPNNALPFD